MRTVLYDRLRLTPRDAKTAHRDHLAKQAGLLMVGVSEPLAERFKAIEEAKWKRKEKRIGEARAKGPVVGPMKRTDYQAAADIAVPLLEQLKTSPPWEVLRDDYLESMREVAEERDDPSTLDGATFRIGAVGLSTPYYAEDHGAAARVRARVFCGMADALPSPQARTCTRASCMTACSGPARRPAAACKRNANCWAFSISSSCCRSRDRSCGRRTISTRG